MIMALREDKEKERADTPTPLYDATVGDLEEGQPPEQSPPPPVDLTRGMTVARVISQQQVEDEVLQRLKETAVVAKAVPAGQDGRRRAWQRIGGVLLLLLTVVVVAVVISVALTKDDGGTDEDFLEANGDDATLVASPVPTVAPTPSPTLSSEQIELLRQLQELSVDGGRALSNATSPQYQAFLWLSEDVLATADAYIPHVLATRYGLAALYYSTNGPQSWAQDDHWLSARPVCEWHGVLRFDPSFNCDHNSNLERIDLQKNGLKGSLPAEVALVDPTRLNRPVLSGNQLLGSIPDALYTLQNMRTLDLSLNQLEGGLSSQIGGLVNLEVLQLGTNKLTGALPAVVGNLTRLGIMDLARNLFTGPIPTSYAQLEQLREFRVSDHGLGGPMPPGLAFLPNIKVLELSGNEIGGSFDLVIGSPLVEVLTLNSNSFTGTLGTSLGLMTSLRDFQCASCSIVGGLPDEIGNATELRQLNLPFLRGSFNSTIPSTLGNLAKLTNLDFLRSSGFRGNTDYNRWHGETGITKSPRPRFDGIFAYRSWKAQAFSHHITRSWQQH
jgi:Leucine-rich repeat (LRR) protein